MNIIILGPQGSGKGTQGELLAAKFGFFYLSTGQMFRNLANNDPDLAQLLNQGGLIADDQLLNYLSSYLMKHNKFDNVILDGSPRTVYQYTKIKQMFESHGATIDLAIFLSIRREESIRRLSARRIDKDTGKIYNLVTDPPPAHITLNQLIQREDDKPEAIEKRLAEFTQETLPLLNVLRKDGILVETDGERPISQIHADLVRVVEAKMK